MLSWLYTKCSYVLFFCYKYSCSLISNIVNFYYCCFVIWTHGRSAYFSSILCFVCMFSCVYNSYELYISLSSKRRPFDIGVSVPLGYTSITGWVSIEWTGDIAPEWCSGVERAGLYNWTVPGCESVLAPASLSRLLNHPESYSPLTHREITGPTSEGCALMPQGMGCETCSSMPATNGHLISFPFNFLPITMCSFLWPV